MFAWLVSAYPMVTVPGTTTEVYWQVLRGYSPGRLKAAMLAHVKRTRFFPAVAELVELANVEPCPHVEKVDYTEACLCGEYRCAETHQLWCGTRCTECGHIWWSMKRPC